MIAEKLYEDCWKYADCKAVFYVISLNSLVLTRKYYLCNASSDLIWFSSSGFRYCPYRVLKTRVYTDPESLQLEDYLDRVTYSLCYSLVSCRTSCVVHRGRVLSRELQCTDWSLRGWTRISVPVILIKVCVRVNAVHSATP